MILIINVASGRQVELPAVDREGGARSNDKQAFTPEYGSIYSLE